MSANINLLSFCILKTTDRSKKTNMLSRVRGAIAVLVLLGITWGFSAAAAVNYHYYFEVPTAASYVLQVRSHLKFEDIIVNKNILTITVISPTYTKNTNVIFLLDSTTHNAACLFMDENSNQSYQT